MSRKPRHCAYCGSNKVRPIVYGEPTTATFEAAERGEVKIGGCVITDGIPVWDCADCRGQFGCLDSSEYGRTRSIDEWLELVESMLPNPVRKGSTSELIGGDPAVVIVRVGAGGIEIMEAGIDWSNPSCPMTKGNPFAKVALRARATRVAELIAKAHGHRVSSYRWCPMCQGRMEPEHMLDSICQGCAEKYLGVVH